MNASRLFGFVTQNNQCPELDEILEKIELKGLKPNKYLREKKIFLGEFKKDSPRKDIEISPDENILVFIDGHITNSEELKTLHNLTSIDDSKLIRDMYQKGIKDIHRHLIGNYVVVIYDLFSEKIKIFKDHFGTRPLYYYYAEGIFIFSSEINPIKDCSNKTFNPNKKRIIQYLCQFKENSKETFYEEIFSLEPSSIISYENGAMTVEQYDHYRNYYEPDINFNEAKEKLKTYLYKACNESLNLAKDKQIGVLLSGGLDSSVIYKTIESIQRKKPRSISENFISKSGDWLKCDETYYQSLVHENLGHHYSVVFDEQSPYEKIDDWLERFGEPFNLANSYLFEEVMIKAKENGIDVLFDGVDGDTVVSYGLERIRSLFKLSTIHIFIYEFILLIKNNNFNESSKFNQAKLLLKPILKENKFFSFLFKMLYSVKGQPKNKVRIVKKKYLNKYHFEESYDVDRNFRSHKEKIKNPLIETAFCNLNILFNKYDVYQFSPFFDLRLVQFCNSLPSQFKLKNGITRFIQREAFSEMLPIDIYKRSEKANLTINFLEKITNEDFRMINNEIKNTHLYIEDEIDKPKLIDELSILSKKTMSDRVAMNIWNYVLVNRWLHKNFPESMKK